MNRQRGKVANKLIDRQGGQMIANKNNIIGLVKRKSNPPKQIVEKIVNYK